MARALTAIVLAAGKGTRMRSSLPKVLHRLGGRTMVAHVLEALAPLAPERIFVIVGHGAERVRAELADWPGVECVLQAEQRGTGHAVQQVLPLLAGYTGDVLVVNGDAPLLRPETLAAVVDAHRQAAARATILTARLVNPGGYGRVFLDGEGRVVRVVEDRDCSDDERRNDRVNVGLYCFDWTALAAVLPGLASDNAQGEIYLPDALVPLAPAAQVELADTEEVHGINDRVQLAQAAAILNRRTLERLMRAGVTIVDPTRTTCDATVEAEPDCIVEPETHLRGDTRLGPGCRVGPGALLEDAQLEAEVEVLYSVVRRTRVGARARIGPFAHLRDGAVVGADCRIGNFVELKNTVIGERTNAAHLSYLGDARLGDRVNIGAGTITANYDGRNKHKTEIGDDARTGSHSVLIAPVKVGRGATVAAGSTIHEDVPDGALAIARVRQTIKPDYRPRWARDENDDGSDDGAAT